MALRHASLILALALAAAACGDLGDSAAETPVPITAGEPATTGASPPAGTDANAATQPEDSDVGPSSSLTTLPLEPETPKPSIVAGPTMPIPIPADPTISRLVTAAITELSALLDDDAAEIALVGLDQVTWGDGSLGCPQPGMSYTQALVDGTRIRLLASGVVFEYHSGGTGDPFYCPNPTEPAAGESGGYGNA